ncbi:MAG TPA: DUF3833 family protein [Sphingomicrobium sp.]
MKRSSRVAFAGAAALLVSAAPPPASPLRFFEGLTESKGTMKVIFAKPYRTYSRSLGRIQPDGSLSLIQKVEDEGKPVHERRWSIRQVGAGHYSGTMSEATGPIDIQEVGGRYHFRFKMNGHMSVDQWLSPQDGGTAAQSVMTIRKFGMPVANGEAVIRKLG